MNIYDYINSPDVAEHCRKIGHEFNSLEMAVIIANSNKSLEEKHEAYREIISDYPDMGMSKSSWFEQNESLHEYLQFVIDWQQGAISRFCESCENTMFVPVWFKKSCVEDRSDRLFHDFEQAKVELCYKYKRNKTDIRDAEIERVFLGRKSYGWNDSVSLNEYGEILEPPFAEQISSAYDDFKSVTINLPVPFKIGDIVTKIGVDKPMVLYQFMNSDMAVNCYVLSDNNCGHGSLKGNLDYDHFSLWNLTYYRDDFTGMERFLKYLGHFITEKNDNLPWLLDLYLMFKTEETSGEYKELFRNGRHLPLEKEDSVWLRKCKEEEHDSLRSFGIFWLITDSPDLEDHKLLYFNTKCDTEGKVTEPPPIPFNAKNGKSFNHEATWEQHIQGNSEHKPYNKKEFYYYPRGRVQIANGSATIYLNPNLNRGSIIEEIKEAFGLSKYNVRKIRIVADGSRHYECWLDK